MNDALQELKKIDREVYLIKHAQAVLGWDQETYLPPKGIDERSEQLALLQGLAHERTVSETAGELLDKLGSSRENPRGGPGLSELDGAFLRAWRRRYDRAVKLPKDLVVRLARAVSIGQAKWAEAKKVSNFQIFLPFLGEILDLTIESARLIGYEEHPYDALLDEYEPYMKTSEAKTVFDNLRRDLAPLAARISRAKQPEDSFLYKDFPPEGQERFGRKVLDALGFDRQRARLDVSAHPFTTTLGNNDVRITTRYNRNNFMSALFGSIHEYGHALYELGFSDSIHGTILSEGASLGIHESQSRLWENLVGRSLPFWKYWYPAAQAHFPDALGSVPLEVFYRGINRVRPSLVRVEADEVTYGLHIILRFMLETDLIDGKLAAKDLPEAWRSLSRDLLGIAPRNDAEGVLQDIHWSMGAFGYFPTYALGNLYSAQFFAALGRDLPGLETRIESGNFTEIIGWLRLNIHSHGSVYTPRELCERISGGPLDPSWFIRYLENKYGRIYEL
jgi:carboxypeptidase Taq